MARAVVNIFVRKINDQSMNNHNDQTMTWDRLISIFATTGKNITKQRKLNEFSRPRWDKLKRIPIADTCGTDFLELLEAGGRMTQQYLSSLQTLAIEMGIRTHVVLPRKYWPKKPKISKRAITEDEHRLLTLNIHSIRWRLFLELLWETGASQSDAAHFRIEHLTQGEIVYERMKTGMRAAQAISPELRRMMQLAIAGRTKGYILPSMQSMDQKDRATIFRRHCKRLGIVGVSLHSYRYAWAERAFQLGVPERLAMVALGHNSSAIHRAYARNAKIVAPSLSDYSKRNESQTPL